MRVRERTPSPGPLGALAAAIAVAHCACAQVPPGIRVADPRAVDRAVAPRAPPAGWRRVAVLPFGGDPAHRRPAEELVALGLRRWTGFAVLTPYAFQRWLAREGGAGAAALHEAARWTAPTLDSEPGGIRGELPGLAARLEADALVLGRVEPGGEIAELVLVDGASGDAMATLRRAGSNYAAERGTHELAMSATGRALHDLVAVLRTPAGQAPRVAATEEEEEAPWTERP